LILFSIIEQIFKNDSKVQLYALSKNVYNLKNTLICNSKGVGAIAVFVLSEWITDA
jgi:hypothetical protein